MLNKFFVSCIFVLFTLVTIGVSNIYADDEPYKIPDGAAVYADVHGDVHDWIGLDEVSVHVHGIVYAKDDPLSNSRTAGNYTLILTVSEPKEENPPARWRVFKKWGRENYKPDVVLQGSFSEGLYVEEDLTFVIEPRKKINFDTDNIGWTASATIELIDSAGNVSPPIRDYDEKKIGEEEENPDWEDAQGNEGPAPTPGISVEAGDNPTYRPGDSVTLNLVTSEAYYDVTWYVHTPWDTSSSGTYQDYTYGGGASTEASLSYTFPSGAMHTGDFVFRAVIYNSDMSSYEETYSITVE